MEAKKLWKSKTFWAGVSAVVAGFGMFITGDQTLPEFLLGANGVVAVVLRMFTSGPVEM